MASLLTSSASHPQLQNLGHPSGGVEVRARLLGIQNVLAASLGTVLVVDVGDLRWGKVAQALRRKAANSRSRSKMASVASAHLQNLERAIRREPAGWTCRGAELEHRISEQIGTGAIIGNFSAGVCQREHSRKILVLERQLGARNARERGGQHQQQGGLHLCSRLFPAPQNTHQKPPTGCGAAVSGRAPTSGAAETSTRRSSYLAGKGCSF